MGQVADTIRGYARAIRVERAAKTKFDQAKAKSQLDVVYSKMIEAILGTDETTWDDMDKRCYDWFRRLDEGDV